MRIILKMKTSCSFTRTLRRQGHSRSSHSWARARPWPEQRREGRGQQEVSFWKEKRSCLGGEVYQLDSVPYLRSV